MRALNETPRPAGAAGLPEGGSAVELHTYLGRYGLLNVKGLKVGVVVVNARRVFNRLDFEVEAHNGVGRDWVAASSLAWLESEAEEADRYAREDAKMLAPLARELRGEA